MRALVLLVCLSVGCLAQRPQQCTSPPLLTGSMSVFGWSCDLHPGTTKTILSGFRKARLIGTELNGESDKRHAEEKVVLHLPVELVELFRRDTEDEEFNGFSDLEWNQEYGQLA